MSWSQRTYFSTWTRTRFSSTKDVDSFQHGLQTVPGPIAFATWFTNCPRPNGLRQQRRLYDHVATTITRPGGALACFENTVTVTEFSLGQRAAGSPDQAPILQLIQVWECPARIKGHGQLASQGIGSRCECTEADRYSDLRGLEGLCRLHRTWASWGASRELTAQGAWYP